MARALEIERRSRYSDFHGRTTTFSNFMRQTSARLSRRYPLDNTWVTIRGLFRQYPNMDLDTRISIIKRANELLAPHLALLASKKEREAREANQNSQEPIDDDAADAAEFEAIAEAGDEADSNEDAVAQRDTFGVRVPGGTGRPEGGSQGGTTSRVGDAPDLRTAGQTSSASGSSAASRISSQSGSGTTNRTGSTGGTGASRVPSSDAQPPNRVSIGARNLQVAMTNSGVPKKNIPPVPPSNASGNPGQAGTISGAAGPSGLPARSGASGSFNQTGTTSQSSSSNKGGAKVPTSKNPEEVQVQFVKGVGPKMGAVLNGMGIVTVMDLLRHYPRRHLDFQNRQYIRDLEEDQEVSVFGVIRSVSAFQSKRRPMSILTVLIHDGTGGITITRFVGGKSNKYLLDRYKAQFPKGAQVLASGVVERDKYSHKLTLKNAEVEILTMDSDTAEEREVNSLHAGRLVPVYPLTEGLSLRHLRTIIHNALESYGAHIEETLPAGVRNQLDLMGLREALKEIHFPMTVEGKDEARRRLVFDELFAIQLQCAHRRYKFDSTEGALSIKYSDTGLVKQMIEALPFALTGAQNRVFAEIARDLSSSKPMHRLVQGDVGSGKTVVALLAFLVAVENNFQGAMMAPTEILAEQHFRQFERLLTPLGLRAALVLGKHGVKQRREVRQQILTGQVHIAVGTHALLEDDVEFKNLGLIVIDEQHRFGVKQRARLKAKSLNPELLTMTATPIPRTLAMTMHGDLDVSEIDELPPGRKPIKTKAVRPSQKKELWDFTLKEVMSGRQVYIVFPLIEESESLSAKAATKEFERLQNEFPQLQFGLMHGKLKPQEKDEVMEKFRTKEFNVLVSTTVIEVGVDVPNATIMIIENADRFGLAQLHQLRGRVGRGQDQSYCFLVADMKSETTRQRLDIMQQTNDGFVIAEKDLEIRGPGEFLGYKQSGLPDLLLADLVQDAKILEDARNTAIAIIKEDPELVGEPQLRKVLDRRLGTAEAEIMRSG